MLSPPERRAQPPPPALLKLRSSMRRQEYTRYFCFVHTLQAQTYNLYLDHTFANLMPQIRWTVPISEQDILKQDGTYVRAHIRLQEFFLLLDRVRLRADDLDADIRWQHPLFHGVQRDALEVCARKSGRFVM